MTIDDPQKKIKEYWETRAADNPESQTATTQDVHLRELEIRTLIRTIGALNLPPGSRVLDVGCGDGYSTLRVAAAFPDLRFTGVDYAQNMVENARRNLAKQPELANRAEFRQGDATRLGDACGDAQYDVVTTDRCLINLHTPELQYEAIRQIAARLRPGGWYVAIENFLRGQENLNRARSSMGLKPIDVRWHNLFLEETEFRDRTATDFRLEAFDHFSSAYYYSTRVLYSALCRDSGEEPDYDHPIHRRAVDLPSTGEFSPICLAVLQKREVPLSEVAESDPAIAGFAAECAESIAALGADTALIQDSYDWIAAASKNKYSYHFEWLGRPIIQFPADVLALQEIIWKVRPKLIVETGIAHGGSLIFHASMLELIGGDGIVVGVDIDIRPHNRTRIERHPLAHRLHLIQGSSIDPQIAQQVAGYASERSSVLVILDSNHTADHVREELRLYSPLVTTGSYVIVFDTIVEHMPDALFPDRPWNRGNNPMTAVREFVASDRRFEVDAQYRDKLLITAAPSGYLRRVAD